MNIQGLMQTIAARYQPLAAAVYQNRCSVQRLSELDDGRGGWTESFRLVSTDVPCAYVPYPSAKEIVIAGQAKGFADGDVWLPARFNSELLDVTEKDRLIIAALGTEPERNLEIIFPAPHQGILIQAIVRQVNQPSVSSLQTQFFYDDLSPLSLGTVMANKIIRSVTVHVQEAFDDGSLSVGTMADPDVLMAAALINPLVVETFKVQPNISYGSDTELFLTIDPGLATQGSGYVEIEVDA